MRIKVYQVLLVLLVVALLPISTAFAQSGVSPCYYVDQSTVSGAGICAPGYGPTVGLVKQGGDTTPQHITCCKGAPAAPPFGYFALVSGWNGNMAGLSGANAKCLTSLQNNSWKGKTDAINRGILTSTNVKAWLCDSSTCQNLIDGVQYAFAEFGQPTGGGSSFIANASSGLLPPEGKWNDANEFAQANSIFWSGRTAAGNPDPTNTCNNWTTTAASGVIGATNGTGTGVWSAGTSGCSSGWQLVCMVNP